MKVCVLKSKLHNAVITETKLNYEGSITIDMEIVRKAKMFPYEKVLIADITNGSRFETYIIPGKEGSKVVCINGAAARLVQEGDRIIVMAFTWIDESETEKFKPVVLKLDQNNNII